MFKLLIIASLMIGAFGNKKPSYTPAYKPNYAPKYGEVPACAKNNSRPYCIDDSEYPIYEIQAALDKHYQAVQALYRDVYVNTGNSVETLKNLVDETYLCPSTTAYIQPYRAINIDGKWRIIVNKVESYNYKYTQSVRVEECDIAVGTPCPLVSPCYESKCVQKNLIHRFLIYDPYDYYFPFAVESFKLPASCGCVLGAFFP